MSVKWKQSEPKFLAGANVCVCLRQRFGFLLSAAVNREFGGAVCRVAKTRTTTRRQKALAFSAPLGSLLVVLGIFAAGSGSPGRGGSPGEGGAGKKLL